MRIRFSQQGITLMEAVVLIAIFTLVMLMISNAVVTFYQTNRYLLQQAQQVDNARNGIETFVRDVREMTFADDGTFPLAVIEEHHIGFYSDIDRDNSVEYVEYAFTGTTTLTKSIFNATGSPPTYSSSVDETHTLSRYVQNPELGTSTFTYYNMNGDPVTSPSEITDIRYVTARLIVDVEPGRKPGAFELLSSAAIRNLNEGL